MEDERALFLRVNTIFKSFSQKKIIDLFFTNTTKWEKMQAIFSQIHILKDFLKLAKHINIK